jgi:hypothetical protein
MNAYINIEKVDCANRIKIPDKNESFSTDYNLNEFPIQMIKSVDIYFRDKIDCPFAKGNWICDIKFNDGFFYCIKLPVEMKEEDVLRYFDPLINKLDELNKNNLH